MLLSQRLVQIPFTPIAYRTQEAAQPLTFGLSFDGPAAAERLGPVVPEPQKRKAARPPPALPIRSAELHHPAFLRVNAQAEPLEPFGQDLINPLRVSLQTKTHHEIIRIPRQKPVPAHPRSDLGLEPFIQHIVQKDVR